MTKGKGECSPGGQKLARDLPFRGPSLEYLLLSPGQCAHSGSWGRLLPKVAHHPAPVPASRVVVGSSSLVEEQFTKSKTFLAHEPSFKMAITLSSIGEN